MKDLMFDIETMGTSHNAAVIQIGACYFDRSTGETGDEFCTSIDLKNCLQYGFEKDPDTEKWWEEQNQEVLQNILENGDPVATVIWAFAGFIKTDCCIWSHTTFDFPIIQNYLIRFTEKKMNFRKARDIRTLVDLSGIDLDKYDWGAKTHNALEDCKFQVKYCVDALRLLESGLAKP